MMTVFAVLVVVPAPPSGAVGVPVTRPAALVADVCGVGISIGAPGAIAALGFVVATMLGSDDTALPATATGFVNKTLASFNNDWIAGMCPYCKR
jgi:hypothetical protein